MSTLRPAQDAALRPAQDGALRPAQDGAWRTRRTVRFAHCDPAGIVFYPRFFDIVHEAKEDWFSAVIGLPFRQLITERRRGFPIVHLEADFFAPSRIGDEIDIAITAAELGASSLHLHYALSLGSEPRVNIRTVIVHIDLSSGRPLPIEGELRERIEAFRRQPDATTVAVDPR